MREVQPGELTPLGIQSLRATVAADIFQSSGVRTAVVHEWINARAGGEKVFEQMAKAMPEADLFALTRRNEVPLDLDDRPITTSALQKLPGAIPRGATLPFMPSAWRGLGKDKYDLVLTSHLAFASQNQLARTGINLLYVHSPARYLWNADIDRRGRLAARTPLAARLRSTDRAAAQRATSIACNSHEIARRVADFWGAESRVIYPPVDTEFFAPIRSGERSGDYLLAAGRWVPYKNFDFVVDLAARSRVRTVIVGSGPEEGSLRRLAAKLDAPVEFRVSPSDEDLRSYMQNATALIFPGIEDFGIVPVEALACGTPVIALKGGGILDTVVDGLTGILCNDLETKKFVEAIKQIRSFDHAACVLSAQRFGAINFRTAIVNWVHEFVC